MLPERNPGLKALSEYDSRTRVPKRTQAPLLLLVVAAYAASCSSEPLPTGSAAGGRPMAVAGAGVGGTAGASAPTTAVGEECSDLTGCRTSDDLSCLSLPGTSASSCTAACRDDAECESRSPGAVCSGGICLEGCELGQPGEGFEKCHGREDLGCRFFSSETTPVLCAVDADCNNSAICSEGHCIHVLTACQPACRSDADCSGAFCNFGTGLCQDERPTGKTFGAPCDVDASPDECQGNCIATGDGTAAICSGYCTFGATHGCGWNGSGRAEAACFFLPAFAQTASSGDAGYCAQLCDCNSDCLSSHTQCLAFDPTETGQALAATYSRRGICTLPAPGDSLLEECPGEGGASGAGGVSN
jgi:hypothetical protein